MSGIKTELIQFITSHPKALKDADIILFAKKYGYAVKVVREEFYRIVWTILCNGNYNNALKQKGTTRVNERFVPKEMKIGKQIEQEHVRGGDKYYANFIAIKISKDHMIEDVKYYTKLEKMEKTFHNPLL